MGGCWFRRVGVIRREIDIFLTALMFFTRIPVPSWLGYTYHSDYLQQSSRYFPLIGWIVGGITALGFLALDAIFPLLIAVILSMALSILLTGAFHEDGWADVCDGFGGGMDKMRVLTIMKDSRLGTYGTLGLISVLGLKTALLVELGLIGFVPLALLTAHPLSRLASTSLIYTHDYVLENEDSKAKPLATQISLKSLLVATAFGLVPLLLLTPLLWLSVLPVVGVTWLMARWFARRIAGYTGDCLGAVQQITELVFYLSLVAMLMRTT